MVSRLVLLVAIAASGLITYLLVQRLDHQGHAVQGPFIGEHQCDRAEKLLSLLSGFVHLLGMPLEIYLLLKRYIYLLKYISDYKIYL